MQKNAKRQHKKLGLTRNLLRFEKIAGQARNDEGRPVVYLDVPSREEVTARPFGLAADIPRLSGRVWIFSLVCFAYAVL